MKKTFLFAALAILCISVLAAHPHFQRTSTLTLAQGKEVSVQYVTYPWNEANPSRFPAEGWTPGAKLTSSIGLKSGAASIPAGEYNLKINKQGDDFSMTLVNGEKIFPLESKTEHGLSMQDHLMIDVHVMGDSGYVVLRYGTFNVSGKIEAGE